MPVRFSTLAALKLMRAYSRKAVEVSFFATTDPQDPLRIIDIYPPQQKGFSAYTDPTEKGLADYMEEMDANRGLPHSQYNHIWIHTHPRGMGVSPSSQDDKTFADLFTGKSYYMMIIHSDKGTSCRCRSMIGNTNYWMDHDFGVMFEWGDEGQRQYDMTEFDTLLDANLIIGTHSSGGSSSRSDSRSYESYPYGTQPDDYVEDPVTGAYVRKERLDKLQEMRKAKGEPATKDEAVKARTDKTYNKGFLTDQEANKIALQLSSSDVQEAAVGKMNYDQLSFLEQKDVDDAIDEILKKRIDRQERKKATKIVQPPPAGTSIIPLAGTTNGTSDSSSNLPFHATHA